MTRDEAITILWQYDVNFEPHPTEDVMHAIDMAIEALKAQEKTDLISRQDALDVLDEFHESVENGTPCYAKARAQMYNLLPIQPEKRTEERTETHSCDCISRSAAIRWVKTECNPYGKPTLEFESGKKVIEHLEKMPSAQPTLYGYNIEHLDLIARALQKEDLPPERVVEALTDIGRIVAIVSDEFEETLRRAVDQIFGDNWFCGYADKE